MPSKEGHHAGALSEDAAAMEPEPSTGFRSGSIDLLELPLRHDDC